MKKLKKREVLPRSNVLCMIQASAAFVVVSYGDEIAWDPSVLPQHVRVIGYSSAAGDFLFLIHSETIMWEQNHGCLPQLNFLFCLLLLGNRNICIKLIFHCFLVKVILLCPL